MALLGIGGLAAVIIGVKLASSGGDGDDSVSPARTSSVPTAVTTTVAFTTLPLVITLPPTLPPTLPTTRRRRPRRRPCRRPSSPPTTVAGGVTAPVRSIRYEGGVIHLEGAVPDQATFDTLSSTMAAVVGADKVDARYSIIPGTAMPTSEPMFFPDRFKFAPNSSTLAPEDIAVLDQVMVFLVQNPQVTLDIDGLHRLGRSRRLEPRALAGPRRHHLRRTSCPRRHRPVTDHRTRAR